ncbi:tape measure protein [Faecalispora jeddahensis]|uniref:tape measure protein n=1 Tax=Faecalispora jeddahensis TaxID=1414721 RepID=UPI0027B9E3CF|nr:tape measure protein [Faecalispora jeddahensis]
MGREISLAIMAHENFSDAVTTMRNANQAFNKDLTGTMQKLDAFNKNKITLKVETDKAKQALKEAEKQFSKTGDAADKMALELANSNYENARRNLDLVAKNARQAEKDILSMTGAISKAENRAGTSSAAESTMMKTLSNAGLFKMAGDSLSGLAGVAVSSALGNTIGGAIQSTLSSAATGAAMGSMTGNPMGIAIGAGVGAASGLISSAASVFSSRDDAYKSAVQDSYNSVQEEQQNTLSSGSQIAGQREQNQISFATLLGGDNNAKKYLAEMTKFAGDTPFGYDDLTATSKTMLAYGYKQNEILPELTKIGDAGSALSMSNQDMTYVATSLGRMRSTGKTTLEYLNPLLERGIPVWKYLAEYTGKSSEKVQEMVSKGLLPGEKAAKAISDAMGKEFAGNMEKQSKTYQGLVNSLGDVQDSMNAAMGEGYNEERKKGLLAQQEWLSGKDGTKMSDAYSMIGSWKAELENTREKMIRESMSKAVNEDPEYQKAKSAGDRAKMGEILAKAEIEGEAEYKKTEGYKLQVETEKSLVGGIRETMIKDEVYKQYGYDMEQEFTKGFGEKYAQDMLSIISQIHQPENSMGASKVASEEDYVNSLHSLFSKKPAGKAFGMARVPYNDFPALLHEGERVLTASEARAQKTAPTIHVTVTGNVIKDEADEDRIAQKIVTKILNAMQITN